jgi:Fe2+ or Zn2+ uptake regulation protein
MYELRRSQVARAILDYLWKHPDAQDTLSGITQWWLPEEKIKTRTATVKEALSDLVARGLVLERKGKDSQIHYRINRRKLQKVRAFLKQTWQRAETA